MTETASILLRIAIAICCLAGLYVAGFMQRKYIQAARGGLVEPSVVTSKRAAIAGVPNARIGLAYYGILLLISAWLTPAHPLVLTAACAASMLAAVVSVYLAYSLLFVTRAVCAYCWAGHFINWTLLVLLMLARMATA